ncbi:MAG: pentapeptide repeat-containing protein [Fimbriimonadaceae bacterium]|nr:pentapeptide repeat-containing protein [Fimbriimonadaceae bacterium]
MPLSPRELTLSRLTSRLGAPPPRHGDGRLDLRATNLARADLSSAVLDSADLAGANLRGANLERASLRGALLVGAELAEARLQRADLSGADCRESNLSRAVLAATVVSGTTFQGARLDGAVLREVALWETDLAPAAVQLAGELDLAQAVARVPADDPGAAAMLGWAAVVGDHATRDQLVQWLAQWRWRRWRRELRAAIGAINQRLGDLSGASLSLSRDQTADARRGLSRPDSAPPDG